MYENENTINMPQSLNSDETSHQAHLSPTRKSILDNDIL